MFDALKKLFSEPATLVTVISSAIIGLFGASVAGVAQFQRGGWSGVFRAMSIGMLMAILVGLGIRDYVTSETARLAIVGAASVIGEDALEGLKAIGKGLRSDPLAYISRLIDALRGRSTPPAPTTQTRRLWE